MLAFPVIAVAILWGREWGVRFAAGIAIAVVGFALWVTARRQLAESFSVRAKAKKLVTDGLYSRVRHPVYVFGMLAYAGLTIAWGSLLGWLFFTCAVIVEVVRARKEDAVLEQAFGEEYRQYRARTWF